MVAGKPLPRKPKQSKPIQSVAGRLPLTELRHRKPCTVPGTLNTSPGTPISRQDNSLFFVDARGVRHLHALTGNQLPALPVAMQQHRQMHQLPQRFQTRQQGRLQILALKCLAGSGQQLQ